MLDFLLEMAREEMRAGQGGANRPEHHFCPRCLSEALATLGINPRGAEVSFVADWKRSIASSRRKWNGLFEDVASPARLL